MILVDTSAWIEFFRGTARVAEAVDDALAHNDAAVCGPVLTELRRGFADRRQATKILDLLTGCHILQQPANLWDEAGELGFALRRRGSTIKTLDLLIATYALAHNADLLTADRDFKPLSAVGLRVSLLK